MKKWVPKRTDIIFEESDFKNLSHFSNFTLSFTNTLNTGKAFVETAVFKSWNLNSLRCLFMFQLENKTW